MKYGKWLMVGLVMMTCGTCGCSSLEGFTVANPKFTAEFDPLQGKVRLMSSRDDEGKIGYMTAKVPATAPGAFAGAEMEMRDVEFSSEASSVRKANAYQEVAFAKQIEATGVAWERGINAAGNVAGEFFNHWMPNTGAWVAKALFLAIGVPIAAVFALIVGTIGLVVMIVVLVAAWVFLKRYLAKSKAAAAAPANG